MASTDLTNSAQHSERESRLDGNHTQSKLTNDLTAGADGSSDGGHVSVGRSRDASPASSASGLSSTKGGAPSPASSASGAPPLSMPHPKKFSHVNISRKFLEKSTSAPAHTLSASPVLKTINLSQKPITQTTTSHPRLVTAKLTATPQSGSTAGWSRPSSAVPSSTPTPLPGANSKPASVPTAAPNAAPMPPPIGRVIQPQPRSSQDMLPLKKDASGKPVWSMAKGSAAVPPDKVQTDFPTAAEVAQGRVTKASDKNAQPDAAAAAHKQAVMAELIAEEDTFRGVHLDPNAHHWDEMEEDDDNFLGGVIEFEDGRQYKVQSSDAPRHVSPPRDPSKISSIDPSASNTAMDRPVSKEERFADDFDRSWPRSRPGPSTSQPGGVSSPISVPVQSPQESSRVLFNERSNRLEPYSHQRHTGPGAPQPFVRRSSRSDYSISPTEGRRDAPPHTQFQLLQKGSNGGSPHPESPSFSRAPGDRSPVSPDASRFRDRPPMRRDHPPWQTNGVHGPDSSRATSYGPTQPSQRQSRDGIYNDQARRSSAFEPPAPGAGGDHRRQLPPHLSASATHLQSPRAEDVLPRTPLQLPPPLPYSEPPAPSASSQAADSPATSISGLPVTDLEEVRRAAMHTAAERARLRRQQEEEEREKEKERARRKAAEIEERMKAAEQAKARESEQADAEKKEQEQVLGIIEEAVSSASLAERVAERVGPADGHHDDPSQRAASTRPAMGRAPSLRGSSRLFALRNVSITTSAAASATPTDTDTWRRKNSPIVATAQQDSLPSTLVPPLTVLTHTDLEVKEGENVDVVDFADLGKLVGSEPSQPSNPRPSRAVASDFFSDGGVHPPRQPPIPSKADEGPWRRRSSVVREQTHPPSTEKAVPEPNAEDVLRPVHSASPTESSRPSAVSPVTSQSQPSEDHQRRVSGHYQNGLQKPPAGPHYREAPMSTLNDVMARIKGALDGMHHEAEAPKETQKSQKWLPPALRPRLAHLDFAHPTEVFDVTALEPPHSPKRAWNKFTVKLTHDSRPALPPLKTGLEWPRGQRHLRMDVYSWNVLDVPYHRETMSNEYLFGRPRVFKGQTKYFVKLPRARITSRPKPEGTPASPVVNLPITPPRLRNGHSKEAATSTWRKSAVSPTPTWRPLHKDSEGLGLDTVSRSPPPEAPSTQLPASTSQSSDVASSRITATQQSEPSGVAFSQTTRIESGELQAPVQVSTVGESRRESKSGVIISESIPAAARSTVALTPAKAPLNDTRSEAQSSPGAREMMNGNYAPQAGSAQSPWSNSPKVMAIKESPARAPDPEHLKAVWSQTPDKAHIQPINSLKGIADDLTGVPFSLQDVKSDGGETPPPSGSGPWARMSAYEVTRAFQQVPSSSSNSSQRPQPIAPIPTTAPVPLVASAPSVNGAAPPNPTFAFSPPPMGQPGLRPAYAAYSPMMSAPSPSVMYSQPSPVQRPMVVNGSAPPVYGQPMWVPAMPGPPPPQSAGVMRSPYPAQLVPYPSPGGPVPMYASPMPGMPNAPQQQNGVQSRPPGGMPMVSPVMQPALPQMYAGSPVLVHAPPVLTPGQPYPLPVQQSREPMRPYGQSPAAPHMSSPMRQPPQNGYNPVPSGYPRPPW